MFSILPETTRYTRKFLQSVEAYQNFSKYDHFIFRTCIVRSHRVSFLSQKGQLKSEKTSNAASDKNTENDHIV